MTDQKQKQLIVILTSITLIYTFIKARADYHAFLRLGPGGPPYNIFGWALVTFALRPLALRAKDVTWTGDYPDYGASEEISKLPERKGERALVGGIAPHRQLSQFPDENMRNKIEALFNGIEQSNPSLLETKLSHYEKHNPALYVRNIDSSSTTPRTAQIAQGEIGHIHPDMSVHLYFSPADAKVVIEKKWGERHRLARKRPWYLLGGKNNDSTFGLASTYIMIYGPRNDEELEVLKVLLRCSVGFMTGRDDLVET